MRVGRVVKQNKTGGRKRSQLYTLRIFLSFLKTCVTTRKFQDGWTPARSAADYGFVDVLKLLIDGGADLNKALPVIASSFPILMAFDIKI